MIALVLAAAAGCGGEDDEGSDAGTTSDESPVAIRFTVFPGAVPSLGVYIADEFGYFDEEGVEVSYVNAGTGSSALQVLVSGQTDFTISDITGVALARENTGARVQFVSGQFSRFMGALQCTARSGISGSYPDVMSQLEGRAIGITAPGSSTDTYLRYSMREAGADPAAARIIAAGGVPQLLAAMESGNVDCITSYQPIQRLISDDVATVLDWAEGEGPDIFAEGYSYNGIVATEKFVTDRPEVVEAVSRAMEKAIEFGRDPENAAEIAERTAPLFEGVDVEVLEEVVRETAPTFGYQISEESVQSAQTVFNGVNSEQTVEINYEDIVAAPVRERLAG